MRKALLARPSSLIVNDMKHLIESTGCEPTPLTSLTELADFESDDVAGILISTAPSSKVKDKYWDVIQQSASVFPGKPIFLASYSTVRSTKITASQRLKDHGISHELVSLEELDNIHFSNNAHMLILTQKEISNESKFPSILNCVKKLLNGPTS